MRLSTRPATRRLWAGLTVAAACAGGLTLTSSASAAVPVYQDPTKSVSDRVENLLKAMTDDEKIGQMIQVERAEKDLTRDQILDQITSDRIGSVLSGGGSSPSPNTPTAWADMYDGFQRAAMATRLQIPIIYGIDAVHGNNNVY